MKNRQASAYQNPDHGLGNADLERRAEEAARQMGKSVEEWLHDLIVEQSAVIGNEENVHSHPANDPTKEAVLSNLAERVKSLEGSFSTTNTPAPASGTVQGAVHQAAQNISRNYDEDARILIEGIRARTQKQTQPLASTAPTDARADRLVNMLDTISLLEQRLNNAAQQPAPQATPPSIDPQNAARLAKLEQQLGQLENHLSTVSQPEPSVKPLKKAANVQGRRAFKQAINTIADREGDGEHEEIAYVPKNRPTRSASANGRRDTDKQFQALMGKIEEIQKGTPDISTIEALKAEFADLKQQISNADLKRDTASQENAAAQADAKSEVARLRETIDGMQHHLVSALDDKRLVTLETDVNRIAEFLLKSPDLSSLPEQAEILTRDIGRICDGLLAIIDKNEKIARDNSDLVVVRLEDSLNDLREDIVSHFNDSLTGSSMASAMSSDFEFRLGGLKDHINSAIEHLSGQVSTIEGRVISAADKLETLGNAGTGDPDAALKLAEMEDRLGGAVRDLSGQMSTQMSAMEHRVVEAADKLDALSQQGTDNPQIASRLSDIEERLSGAVRDLSGQFATMENHVISAADKLEILGKARDGDAEAAAKLSDMETRLVKAAERLEEASMEAARAQGETPSALLSMPTNLVTDDTLKSELQGFATQLGDSLAAHQAAAGMSSSGISEDALKNELDGLEQRLGRNLAEHHQAFLTSKMPEPGVNQETLRGELNGLANFIGNNLAAQQKNMLGHIDKALATLQTLADNQTSVLENVARQSAEQAVSMVNQPVSDTGSSREDVNALREDLHGLKASTDSFSDETRSSFGSVQSLLETVSDRLEHLEERQPLAPADELTDQDQDVMALSSDLEVDDAKPEAPAETVFDDDAIMQRMRDHVKAREPDAPLLEPNADDVPLEPGTRKPNFQDMEPDIMSDVTITTPSQDISTEQEPDDDDGKKPQSKADFIAAARRAAQAAASEQASLDLTEETIEPTPSSFSSIRDRINAVAKGSGKKNRDMTAVMDAAEEALRAPEVEEAKKTETSPSIDDHFDPDFGDEVIEITHKSSKMRNIMLGSLIVAILGGGYLFLREPVTTLINGLSTPPQAIVETNAENLKASTAVITPAEPSINNNEAAAPANIVNDPTAETSAQQIPETPTQPAPSNALEDDQAELEIDTTTTQSISPGAIIETAPEPDSLILNALQELPETGVSGKLADALLESDPSAYLEVARRFSEGDIFDRDLKKAAFWYEQAAAKDAPIAQFRLGTLFEDGIGVQKDQQTARQWYVRAAGNGNARAMHNLAVLYAEGAFGEPDFKEAFRWFEKGATHGIKDSQFNVGILYVRGLGVKSDLAQAYKWFDLVARTGDDDAAEKRDEIAKALTPEELETAKAASAGWTKKEWIMSANVITPPSSYWHEDTAFGGLGLPQDQPNLPKGSPLVQEAQALLNGLGFNSGKPDGLIGSKTREAVRAFEQEIGQPQTGRIDQNLINLLKARRS